MIKATRRAVALAALGLAALPLLACGSTRLVGVPLVWKPTHWRDSGVVMNVQGLTHRTIRVEPFVDTRLDRAKFGENQEDSPFRPVTTSGSVSDFVTRQFATTLRQHGLNVVSEGGDVVVSGDVLEFMVTETHTYRGEVRLKVNVRDGGRTAFTGVISGAAGRFGRSYKLENYYETISDALLDATETVLRDGDFLDALAGD